MNNNCTWYNIHRYQRIYVYRQSMLSFHPILWLLRSLPYKQPQFYLLCISPDTILREQGSVQLIQRHTHMYVACICVCMYIY